MPDPKSTSGGDRFQNERYLESMGFVSIGFIIAVAADRRRQFRYVLDTLITDSDTAVDLMCLLIEKWFELGSRFLTPRTDLSRSS